MNMKLLAHHDMGGFGDGGEGMGIYMKNGRRYLYIAHAFAPKDVTAFDITDPRDPKPVFQWDLPHPDVRSNCLCVCGDLLLVCRQPVKGGIQPGGLEVFDLSQPENPRSIGFFDTSGPYSLGAHFVWFVDGEYAYLASGMPDHKPNLPFQDRNIVVIVDMKDPAKPREAGRWWLPGTREGDEAPPPKRGPQRWAEALGVEPQPLDRRAMQVKVGDFTAWDFGYRSHNVMVYPERPDRAYVGYIEGGAIILDIADKSRPKMVGHLEYSPPMAGYTHTVMPIFSKNLLAVTDEAVIDRAMDWPALLWFADMRYEPRPVIISTAPMPSLEQYTTEGRYGAHNLHENIPVSYSWRSDDIIIGAFYTAGVRAYDISDPLQPKVAGYLVPPAPPNTPAGIQINDVYADENGIIYAVDRMKGGLYVVEFTPN